MHFYFPFIVSIFFILDYLNIFLFLFTNDIVIQFFRLIIVNLKILFKSLNISFINQEILFVKFSFFLVLFHEFYFNQQFLFLKNNYHHFILKFLSI